MTSLMYFALFLAAQIVSLHAIPMTRTHNDADTMVLNGRLLKFYPQTGEYISLQKDNIQVMDMNDNHFLRLHFDGEELPPLDMRVSKGSVWSQYSDVVVEEGPRGTPASQRIDPGCFLSGRLMNAEGGVQINRCGLMTGLIYNSEHQFEFEENTTEGSLWSQTTFTVTRRKLVKEEVERDDDQFGIDAIEEELLKDTIETQQNRTSRRKRDIMDTKIEMVIYMDEEYVTHHRNVLGRTSRAKLHNFVLAKWEQVQNALRDTSLIGAKIQLIVKRIVIWNRNPAGYPMRDNYMEKEELFERLNWFCRNTPETNHFDLKAIYTRNAGAHRMGAANLPGVCKLNRKCLIVKSDKVDVGIEIHELGHSLGLPHDPLNPDCKGSPAGFMAWDMNLRFLPCYRPKVQNYLRSEAADCMFEQNVSKDPVPYRYK